MKVNEKTRRALRVELIVSVALPIHLQATSIYADAVDLQRCFRTWGYDSVPAMLRYRVEQYAAR